MPRSFNTAFSDYLHKENTQLSRLYWLQTTSGTAYRVTDWVMPVTTYVQNPLTQQLELATFTPYQGFDATAFVDESRMAVTNAEFSSYFQLEGISAEAIHAGLFSGAIIAVSLYAPDLPNSNAELIFQGEVGEVTEVGLDQFKLEFRGIAQALQQKIGLTVNESCPWSIGDSKCRATPVQLNGAVTTVVSGRELEVEFSTSIALGNNFWQAGLVFLYSNNPQTNGYRIEVASSTAVSSTRSRLVFFYPLPFLPSVGDTVTAISGCRKIIKDCQGRYNNIANFGGFPHLPGKDKLLTGRG